MHLAMVWDCEGFEYDSVFDFDQTGSNIISCAARSSGEGTFKTVPQMQWKQKYYIEKVKNIYLIQKKLLLTNIFTLI